MTTPPTDRESPATIPQSPTREAAECEAGLRRVLAYICARRYRRLIAFAAIFLLIYAIVSIPLSFLSATAYGLLFPVIYDEDIPIGVEVYRLILSMMRIMPSLIITLLIFLQLRKTYLDHIPPDDS